MRCKTLHLSFNWQLVMGGALCLLISCSAPPSGTGAAAMATRPAPTKFDLAFATYFGGKDFDAIRDVCVDSDGNILVVGGTASPDFPTTPGAFDRVVHRGGKSEGPCGPSDAFVAKFDPAGHLLWSTILGGPNYDRAYGVRIDRQNNIYVCGRAGEDFPVTAGAFQSKFTDDGDPKLGFYGKQNGFVAKLTTDGKLLWASYVGSTTLCREIAIDSDGDIYVPGGWSGQGPVPPQQRFAHAFQKQHAATFKPVGSDAQTFMMKIKSDGTQVLWATWLSGTGTDHGACMMAVDQHKRVYFAEYTSSRDLPLAGKTRRPYAGGDNDLYLACLSPDGSQLIYGTYLGGSGDEEFDTHELAVDAQGNAFVATYTNSTDWPVTPGALQSKYGGGDGDQAICKVSPEGELLACTYLGGSKNENIEGMAVDAAGNLYVSGSTYSPDIQITGAALQPTYSPGGPGYDNNGFFAVLNNDLTKVVYSSFYGGKSSMPGKNAYGGFHAAALSPDGSWVVAGSWHSAGFPTKNAFQAGYCGGPTNPPYAASDAVLLRLVPVAK